MYLSMCYRNIAVNNLAIHTKHGVWYIWGSDIQQQKKTLSTQRTRGSHNKIYEWVHQLFFLVYYTSLIIVKSSIEKEGTIFGHTRWNMYCQDWSPRFDSNYNKVFYCIDFILTRQEKKVYMSFNRGWNICTVDCGSRIYWCRWVKMFIKLHSSYKYKTIGW